MPQLTREYVVEGNELCRTTAGRAVDEGIANARMQHEADLAAYQKEHDRSSGTRHAKLAADMKEQKAMRRRKCCG